MLGVDDLSDGDQTRLVWAAHPARQRPGAACAAVGVILAVSWGVHVFAGMSYPWGVLAAIVMVLALNRFFFPSRFEIDNTGISARYVISHQELKWTEIRRFHHDAHGAYLSTRVRRSRWDAYRGMHVLFGNRRDDVLSEIRKRLAATMTAGATSKVARNDATEAG